MAWFQVVWMLAFLGAALTDDNEAEWTDFPTKEVDFARAFPFNPETDTLELKTSMTAFDPVQQKFGFSFAKNEGSEKLMGFQFEFASVADPGNNQPAKKAGWLLTGCMEKPVGLIGDESDLVLGENTWNFTKRDGKLKVTINDGETTICSRHWHRTMVPHLFVVKMLTRESGPRRKLLT